ncbi:DExD-box helicase 52 [Dermatophagoides pteronyssinus]|uniref:DExD-box helicase 52 n=1 Tax=Dermatophagoides pteronyssinus TaxID=6956 RepID=UPI003F66A159
MDAFRLLTKGARFDSKPNRFQTNKSKQLKSNDDDNETRINNENQSMNDEEFRTKHDIMVDGIDQIKSPIKTFDEIDVNYLRENLRKGNYHQPTPIQMQTIPLMLDRQQLIASAPTGSGKTLAFLLPIIIQLERPKSCGFRAIILAPTRELVKQIHRESLWISEGSGLRIHMIKNVNLASKKFNSKSKLKYDILITTPKRLEYLLSLKTIDTTINIDNLEWLIIDEYDRLFQSTFMKQLSTIFNICFERSSLVKLALFSATFNQYLYDWCKLNLNNIITIIIGQRNKVVESIEQKLIFTGNESGKLFALKELIANGCQTPVLIFVNTVRKANFLQRELEDTMNISIDTIHSDRKQEIRDQIVRSFREGKILFLICTELMGRGIDFKAVNLVINYDLPSSLVAYIHHVGRTGRAGRSGMAITFYTLKNDRKNLLSILNVMRQSGFAADIPQHLQKKMIANPKQNMETKKTTKQKRKHFQKYRQQQKTKKSKNN